MNVMLEFCNVFNTRTKNLKRVGLFLFGFDVDNSGTNV